MMVKARAIARTLPVHLLLPIVAHLISHCRAEESNEQLYFRTVGSWKSNGSYQPWEEYTEELLARWHSRKPHQGRLELVGGFEEGILAIEQATVAKGEGQNVQVGRVTNYKRSFLSWQTTLNPPSPCWNFLCRWCAHKEGPGALSTLLRLRQGAA